MEEEKAAAYYDELVRKGGNAAKYKQGLGFGGSPTSRPRNEGYGSLSNFVKSSPGRTALLEKESRLDNIRDKLNRKDDDKNSRRRSPERDGRKDPEQAEHRRRRRSTPDSSKQDRKKKKSSRRRSLSSEENDRTVVKKAGRDRKRRSRSSSRSRSSKSPKGRGRSEAPENDSSSKRREPKPRRSPSLSNGSSGTSSERTRKHNKRSKKDRSRSPGDDSRSRHRISPETSNRSRCSRSRSVEERRRGRSRSRSRGRDDNRVSSRRRNSSYSPGGRREGSSSPASHRRSSKSREGRYGGGVAERYSSYRTYNSRRRQEDERSRTFSYRDRNRRPEEKPRAAQEKTQERDYAKLIPNFESMTPAEKVKAKMKLQLSETVAKDNAKGMSDEWERFDFNKDAPLDDDAKQDYFGDGTGARDDTEFLKNSGSTFPSSTNQVTREAQVRSVHDNAIFGPPQGLRIRVSKPEINPIVENTDARDSDIEDQPIIVDDTVLSRKDENLQGSSKDSAHPATTVLSQQVIAMQQAGSWQERARRMREAKAALESGQAS